MDCWDLKIFKNSKLAINFLCSNNKKGVMKTPIMDSQGHSFCKKCLKNLITQKKKCPETDHDFKTTKKPIKNLLAEKMINNLDIKCINYEKDCLWEGKLIKITQHLTSDCLYSTIPCTNSDCNEKISRKSITNHLKICEYKKILCKFCKNEIIIKNEKNHEAFCPKILIKCKKCHIKIKRDDVDNHIKNICKMSETNCPYIDCNIQGSRKEVRDHVFSKNGLLPHQNMLSERVKKIESNLFIIENFMENYKLKYDNLKKFLENEKKSNGFFSPDFHNKNIIVDHGFKKVIKISKENYGFVLMKDKLLPQIPYCYKLFCKREIGIGIADPFIVKKNDYSFHDTPLIENCYLFKIKPISDEISDMKVELVYDDIKNCLVFTNFDNDGKTSLNLGGNDVDGLHVCFILLDEGDCVEILVDEESDFFDEVE